MVYVFVPLFHLPFESLLAEHCQLTQNQALFGLFPRDLLRRSSISRSRFLGLSFSAFSSSYPFISASSLFVQFNPFSNWATFPLTVLILSAPWFCPIHLAYLISLANLSKWRRQQARGLIFLLQNSTHTCAFFAWFWWHLRRFQIS